jgi:hypothetical protein
MLKRLLFGLVLGLVLGGVVAAVLVQGLGIESFAGVAVYAYLSAAVTGVLAGLVAGKPIWSGDGKIEAGLKAFFGGLLALGAMFALRQWVAIDVDLTSLRAGSGTVGDLPAASLPLIAAVLAGFFELDNSSSDAGKAAASDDKGAARPASTGKGSKVRVAPERAAEEDEEAEEPPVAKKKRR